MSAAMTTTIQFLSAFDFLVGHELLLDRQAKLYSVFFFGLDRSESGTGARGLSGSVCYKIFYSVLASIIIC